MKTTDSEEDSCHVVHLKRQTVMMITCLVVMLQNFVKKTMAHLDTWSGKDHEGRTGSGQSDRKCRCDWTFVDPCFRMMRGFLRWRT